MQKEDLRYLIDQIKERGIDYAYSSNDPKMTSIRKKLGNNYMQYNRLWVENLK